MLHKTCPDICSNPNTLTKRNLYQTINPSSKPTTFSCAGITSTEASAAWRAPAGKASKHVVNVGDVTVSLWGHIEKANSTGHTHVFAASCSKSTRIRKILGRRLRPGTDGRGWPEDKWKRARKLAPSQCKLTFVGFWSLASKVICKLSGNRVRGRSEMILGSNCCVCLRNMNI